MILRPEPAAAGGVERPGARLIHALGGLHTGVVDTSTLIVLDRAGLLADTAACVSLLLTGQVAREAGALAAALGPPISSGQANADAAVVETAASRGVPVLSEDRRLLREAGRRGLAYYNALMLVLALRVQGRLSRSGCHRALDRLLPHCRYSRSVLAYGRQLLALMDG